MSTSNVEFTALQDFDCAETQSSYIAGLSYVAQDPGLYADDASRDRATALLAMIPQWVEDDKIAVGPPIAASDVEGSGSIEGG